MTRETTPAAAVPPSPDSPPGISLENGVATPIVGPFSEYSQLISVAADGTLWVASVTPGATSTEASLATYDFGQTAMVQAWSATANQVDSLAAVSVDTAYVVVTDTSTWAGVVTSGTMTQLAALPGSAIPAQVAAAADGTVWLLDTAGIPYVYANGAATAVPTPGAALASVSVGSADFVLAVDDTGAAWSWSSASGWTSFMGVTSVSWIAACADGTAWFLGAGVLAVVLADGTVTSLDVSSVAMPASWAAASRMSAFVLAFAEGDEQMVVYPVALGILDMPAVAWPSWTTAQTAAYLALSSALDVSGTEGVRGQYTNAIAPFSAWYSAVLAMHAPHGVNRDDWKVVNEQIATELLYVQSVYNLFANMATLTGLIGVMQSDQLQGVAADCGLTVQAQGQSEVSIVLEAMMGTLIEDIGGVFEEPYSLAASLIGSGLVAAAEYTTQNNNPGDSSQNLTVAYSQLATVLSGNLAQAVTEQESEQTTILTDWGKLSAAGQAIAQGIWSWPVGLTGQSLTALVPALQLYFYQALMPARWQILEGFVLYGPDFPTENPQAPAYALMSKQASDDSGNLIVWFYVCCGAGSDANILSNTGPWPAQSLLSDIFALGVAPSDFFGGENGWSLPATPASGWTPPPAAVPWNAYS